MKFLYTLSLVAASLLCGTTGKAQCNPVLGHDSLQFGALGAIRATTVVGNTLYVGGEFSVFGKYTGSFAGIDTMTAKVVTTGAWPRVKGIVNKIISDGAGGWYIGGQFSQVGDSVRHHLAQIDASGHVTSFRPEPDSMVEALLLNGPMLYVGGQFHIIGGVTRNHAAKLNIATNTVTSWNPNADADVMTFTLYNNRVYTGGNFFNIGGQLRKGAAKLDTLSGLATAWNPNVNVAGPGFTSKVATIAFDAAGRCYLGGIFNTVGSLPRQRIAKVDTGAGTTLPWDVNLGGGLGTFEVAKIIPNGATIYIAGGFSNVNGGTLLREAFAEVDTGTALATSFDPTSGTGAWVIYDVVRDGNKLFVCGHYGSPDNYGVGVVRISTGSFNFLNCASDNSWNTILTLGLKGGTLYAGGDFRFMGASIRHYGAAVDLLADTVTAWDPGAHMVMGSPVNCITASPGRVFIGGEFIAPGPAAKGFSNFYLAATDPLTGVSDTTFGSPLEPATATNVRHLLYDAGKLYLSGTFSGLDGYSRIKLGRINSTTGATDLTWNPADASYTYDIAPLEMQGSNVYVGGYYSKIGGQFRNNLSAISKTGTGLATSFDPGPNASVEALAVRNGKLFVGGYFDSLTHVWFPRLCKVDLVTGAPDVWRPTPNGTVKLVKPYYNMEFIAGSFDHIGPTAAHGLGRVNEMDTVAGNWDPQPDGDVNDIAFYGDRMYVGGGFSNIEGSDKYYLALYKLPFTPDTVHVSGPTSPCIGETALYTAATPISGVTYRWRKNGTIVGTSTPTYSYIPASGDVITCTIIPPTGGCYTADSGISNALNITVPALIVPTITLAMPSGAAAGETVTVNATVGSTGGAYSIRWYVNGALSGTTSTPVFTFTKGAGMDDVKATIIPSAPYCYDTAVSALVQVRDVTGVDNMASNNVWVYPNPSNGKFIISKLMAGDDVRVFDLNGRVQFELSGITNSQDNVAINLSSLTPGCYFLSVNDKEGSAVLRTVLRKE